MWGLLAIVCSTSVDQCKGNGQVSRGNAVLLSYVFVGRFCCAEFIEQRLRLNRPDVETRDAEPINKIVKNVVISGQA